MRELFSAIQMIVGSLVVAGALWSATDSFAWGLFAAGCIIVIDALSSQGRRE